MDGRGCEDYRCVEVETDVVSNTSGSARVKLVSTVATVRAQGEDGQVLGSQLQAPPGFGSTYFSRESKIQARLWEGICLDLKDSLPFQRATLQVPLQCS